MEVCFYHLKHKYLNLKTSSLNEKVCKSALRFAFDPKFYEKHDFSPNQLTHGNTSKYTPTPKNTLQ